MKMIRFFSADKKINVSDRISFKKLLHSVFELEKKQLRQLRFIFCSDEYLLEINESYLQHNYFTDVITFCLSEKNAPINGEIYLSIDRIKENAKLYSVSYQKELLRVMIHGSLHLCGYQDNQPKSKKKMSEKEEYFLNRFYKST